MKRICSAVAAIAWSLASAPAWAHPGHGVIPPDEPAHWLEPVHLLPVLGTVAMAAIAARLLKGGRDTKGPR